MQMYDSSLYWEVFISESWGVRSKSSSEPSIVTQQDDGGKVIMCKILLSLPYYKKFHA